MCRLIIWDFARLWSQLLVNFVIPQVPKSPPKERKVVIVGITRLLTQSTLMLQNQALIQAWCVFPSSLSVSVSGGELTWSLPFLHTQAAHVPSAREALPDGTAAVEEGGARPRRWADAD